MWRNVPRRSWREAGVPEPRYPDGRDVRDVAAGRNSLPERDRSAQIGHSWGRRLSYNSSMNRREYPVRVYRRGQKPPDTDSTLTTVAERLAMMWPLALEAWAFMGEPVVEPRLPRHVVRVIRGGR